MEFFYSPKKKTTIISAPNVPTVPAVPAVPFVPSMTLPVSMSVVPAIVVVEVAVPALPPAAPSPPAAMPGTAAVPPVIGIGAIAVPGIPSAVPAVVVPPAAGHDVRVVIGGPVRRRVVIRCAGLRRVGIGLGCRRQVVDDLRLIARLPHLRGDRVVRPRRGGPN